MNFKTGSAQALVLTGLARGGRFPRPFAFNEHMPAREQNEVVRCTVASDPGEAAVFAPEVFDAGVEVFFYLVFFHFLFRFLILKRCSA